MFYWREEVREKLKNIYDIERIIGKLVLETENGRDLVALKYSIKNFSRDIETFKWKPYFCNRGKRVN